MYKAYFSFFILLFISIGLYADVKLPSIFSDHMVLQQKSDTRLWGWAKPLEQVTITTSWDNKILKDTTDHFGNWEVKVTTPSYGGPYKISFQGYNKIELNDVMIGEVWLVSGQSNMEWSVDNGINDGEAEAKLANYPQLRLFKTYVMASRHQQEDVSGSWANCTPESMRSFSAIGYYFGRKLLGDLNIPIGIISSSWGGTPAEAWIPESFIKNDPVLYKNAIEKVQEPWGPKDMGVIYNAMIHPLLKTNVKGVLWYQGESNTSHSNDYDRLLSSLVSSWRNVFNNDFPFYFVQIAPYTYGGENGVELRNAQRRADDNINNSAMVVVSDIGDIKDIHPRNKKDVGLRLANIALKNNYGKNELKATSPKLIGYTIDRNKIILNYESNGNLICNEACKKSFEITDTSGKYAKADVVIKSNTITLSSKNVAFPINARWNWCNTCSEILTDDSGLPASSFMLER
jgi:sialate O-acetylesterase